MKSLKFRAPTRTSLVLGALWVALGTYLTLSTIGPKVAGDLTLPGLAFFVITAVLASRIYTRVRNPEPTPIWDTDAPMHGAVSVRR